MDDTQGRPGTAPAGPSALEKLVPYRRQFSYALLGLALVGAVLLVVMLARSGAVAALSSPVFYWGLFSTLTLVVVGVLGLTLTPEGGVSEAEQLRMLLLVLGGALGLFSALLGLLLPFLEYRALFAGGAREWRREPRALVWTGLALFGGLILMFVSIQLTRGMERTSA